jgi:hypothetical protein
MIAVLDTHFIPRQAYVPRLSVSMTSFSSDTKPPPGNEAVGKREVRGRMMSGVMVVCSDCINEHVNGITFEFVSF